jgi:hypothetical protein
VSVDILRVVRRVAMDTEQDRIARIMSVVSERRAPMLVAWWRWSAYLAAAISATQLTRIRFGVR